ncbi:MAG: HAD family phosphatase [Proteobacteria bacterium]|nr:HAD family phosphatase [Pseudomonadota bacterium]
MLKPIQELKAIFFDLDNVLVFSEVMHFKAWQMVMHELGVDPNLLDFQSLMGISDSAQSVILKERFGISESATTIWSMKRSTFATLLPTGFSSPEGRNDFLEKASQQYITAVVSSSGNTVIQAVLNTQNISSYFDFIIGHDDCERHKPDPLPYLYALEKAQIKAAQALVIEDSPSGITAALNAQIPVIGILKDQTPDQLLPNITYFNSFTEISHWLYQPPAILSKD